MKLRVLILAVLATLVFSATATAAEIELPLTQLASTEATVTLGWTPPAEAVSYTFWVGGERVSNSQDPTRSSVKFARAACDRDDDCYIVKAQGPLAKGGWPHNPQCSNKKDDDHDGKVDYPADPGCSSATDTDETDPPPAPQCSDGIDNADPEDTLVDYPADPGCSSATDTDETDPTGQTTISPSQFNAMAVSGATISNVHVTGDVAVTHTNVSVSNSTFDGEIGFEPGAGGSSLRSSTARMFYIAGADNIVIDGNFFDGQKRTSYNFVWDSPAGNTPSNWRITNNTFQHFWVQADPSNHSEALYIGYSDHGLIQGNRFFDNGTTSHVFFTWFGDLASSTHWPNNICVKGNEFRDDPNGVFHYYAINFRSEIKTSANIVTDPNEIGFSTTSPEFNGVC